MICSRYIIVNILYEGDNKYDDDAKTSGMSKLHEYTNRCIVCVNEEKQLGSRLSRRYYKWQVLHCDISVSCYTIFRFFIYTSLAWQTTWMFSQNVLTLDMLYIYIIPYVCWCDLKWLNSLYLQMYQIFDAVSEFPCLSVAILVCIV